MVTVCRHPAGAGEMRFPPLNARLFLGILPPHAGAAMQMQKVLDASVTVKKLTYSHVNGKFPKVYLIIRRT